MELALKNVPQELVADFLREELEPMIKALGIADWSLQKPRRRRIASILFLNVECGAKFLAKFGKIVHGRANGKDKARLFIARVPIYVEMSKREIDRHMLSSLQLENEKRLKRAARRQTEPRSSEFQPLSGLITEIRLGKNVFAGAQPSLMFCQQSVMRHTANAKFTRLAMSVMSTGLFRIDIPYDIVMELIADYSSATITLVLTESPRFYAIIDASSLSSASWERATSCPHWPDHNEYAAQCLVYQFPIAIADFNAFISNLDKFEVLTIARGRLPIIHDPAAGEQDYKTCLAAFEGKLHTMRTKGTRIPFTIKFQVQALVWGNYLHPVSGTKMLKQMESIARLPGIQGKPQVPTVASMRKLFQLIPYPVFDVDPQALDSAELVKTVLSQDQELRQQGPMYDKEYGTTLPENQAWVMKAMVTPTRVLLYGPEPESKNRVLRKFPDKHEYFLRVLFCDEDGQDLTFNPKVSLEAVYRRFRSFFSNGIKIAGRRYSFLGFSHSSLRSHSAWFMAPFIDNNMERQTCDTVISSLGKFSGIKTPAKCAARIGQAFSETPYSVPIKQTGITVGWIPDVKSKDGTRVFSDGVGTMSWDALEEIWNYILPVRSAPTSVQIRLGGVKGMLSLDSRLSGKVICLREESMMKFPSDDMTDLGICDTASKPFRFYLNRQVIKILEDMGTQDDWFITLQARALRRLQSVTATPGNTATFLQQQNIGSSIRFSQCIRKLDMMKLDYRRDEFLKTAVEHIVLRELRLLKHKARIPVPKGVTLFGVMDETAFLQPNEIYVTFSAQRNDIASCPGEGLALVTRSPALHPGDIQIVKMITPPPGHSLLKHRDCVVFSQLGDRDLPSQLSGGDLDGDLYNIIWDEDALPDRSFAPADYPRTTPQSLDRDVNREDIADFFINFMRTDLLGMIAVRHQIMADVKNTGTQDPACKLLAELHSTAVDSSKSGIAVDMMQIPKAPSTRPDL
jgi:hypothetical protein